MTAAVLALGLAFILVAALTRTNDSLMRASSLEQVVAQVRTGFGDDLIARVSDHGSTLGVTLAARPADGRARMKGLFEAQVLGAAVADWMRLSGRKPITTLLTADHRGAHLSNNAVAGDPVPSGSGLSSLRPGECESLARSAAKSPLTLASATTLPYLHGVCVVRFRTYSPIVGSTASVAAFAHVAVGLGNTNERPRFFELDDHSGRPVDAFSWLPRLSGSEWARDGIPFPFAHG